MKEPTIKDVAKQASVSQTTVSFILNNTKDVSISESTRKKVLEFIRKSIDEVVYDEVKQMPVRMQAKQDELSKTKAQREQDAHDSLFGKDKEQISYRLNLHESEERPKITTDELEQFEQEFKSRFPEITFDKQIGIGKNGQIVDFPVIDGKTDAVAVGKITIDNNSLGFKMSLASGLKIKSIVDGGNSVDFEINKKTKDIFGKLLNLYEELFKKRFNEIINPAEEEMADDMSMAPMEEPVAPAAPAPAAPAPAV